MFLGIYGSTNSRLLKPNKFVSTGVSTCYLSQVQLASYDRFCFIFVLAGGFQCSISRLNKGEIELILSRLFTLYAQIHPLLRCYSLRRTHSWDDSIRKYLKKTFNL